MKPQGIFHMNQPEIFIFRRASGVKVFPIFHGSTTKTIPTTTRCGASTTDNNEPCFPFMVKCLQESRTELEVSTPAKTKFNMFPKKKSFQKEKNNLIQLPTIIFEGRFVSTHHFKPTYLFKLSTSNFQTCL